MQRLMKRFAGQRADRGATAVVVALLLVPLMAMAALAVDVAAMYNDKQQLQMGADAAALAVAQDCAYRTCGTADDTSEELATSNIHDGDADAGATLAPADGLVTVDTSTVRRHWFAPLIGINETLLNAQATAQWGRPVKASGLMPLIFGLCELDTQDTELILTEDAGTGEVHIRVPDDAGAVTVLMPKHSGTGCNGPSGLDGPGGFGWLNPNGDHECFTAVLTAGNMTGENNNGNSGPGSKCAPYYDALIGTTILLPVHDEVIGKGSKLKYEVFGFLAFELEGYFFGNNLNSSPIAGCSNSTYCIRGTFTDSFEAGSNVELSPDAPDSGVTAVRLVS